MVFPSKKDRWLSTLLWVIAGLGFFIPLVNGDIISAFVILPFALFLLWFWFRTDYCIKKDKIKIRYGPIRQTVLIKDIKTIIKARKNPFAAAPSLSLDRIVLHCGKFDVTSISPRDQEEFLKSVLEINPEIEIDKRLV
ncbi:PH domain-containing protein [Virgibacillus salexigens]|uniref:PH domain-containing protein n=1 Tax=Virgibacillus salexigens TaxID=61016 RepID=UPI001909C424|nr:PH domain-containing protein [Virgibacillus salexigens]